MGKFDKFLQDPKRFASDSKVLRRVALFKSEAYKKLGGEGPTWSACQNSEELRSQILDAVSSRARIMDTSLPGTLQIGVLYEDRAVVSALVDELQQERDLDLRVEAGRQVLPTKGLSLLAIDDHLLGHNVIHVMIINRTTGEQLLVEFHLWELDEGFYTGPKSTPWLRRLTVAAAAEAGAFERGRCVHVRELGNATPWFEPTFPIDVVYTWVNHEDPEWKALYAKHVVGVEPEPETRDATSLDRFRNRNELKYSLRSLMAFAPWLRSVHIVTNCAPPDWIDLSHPKVNWVSHEAIFPEGVLPTFSSHAIESRLQHVPDLADHFIYMNDDVFLGRPVQPGDFFHVNGMSRSFLEEYGSVAGEVRDDDPDYLNAARNGQRLLEHDFGHTVTALHKHMPIALRKDVLLEMEERFADEISRTTRSRVRSKTDISTVSFLYHHFAYLTCRSTIERSSSVLVKAQTARYERKLSQILAGSIKPLSVCLNDGGGTERFPHWGRHVVEFLEAMYPRPGELERIP